jgi:hypothetical protein
MLCHTAGWLPIMLVTLLVSLWTDGHDQNQAYGGKPDAKTVRTDTKTATWLILQGLLKP